MAKRVVRKFVVSVNVLLIVAIACCLFLIRQDLAPEPARVEDRVVRLACVVDGSDVIYGSSVIISTGRLLTAAHIPNACKEANGVLTDYKTHKMHLTLLKISTPEDLALLEIENSPSLPKLTLAPTNPPLNSDIRVWGFPGSESVEIVTSGVVSGYDKITMFEGVETFRLLTDTRLTFGNSGGPVVDDQGRLVGIVSGGLMPVAADNSYRLGIIVPVNTIRDFLNSYGK